MTARVARDYTGVSTRELGAIFERHLPPDVLLADFADMVGIDDSELKRIVITHNYQFVGLHKADRILLGLGLNLSHLVSLGEITVVPAQNKNAAILMAQDEFWARGETPTNQQIETRAKELRDLRGWVLGPKTDTQKQVAEREKNR